MRQDGESDRGIDVADDRVRKLSRIDFAPGHRFMRSGAGEAPRIGTRVGDLNEVVMSFFLDPKHLLDLRFGLEGEILPDLW